MIVLSIVVFDSLPELLLCTGAPKVTPDIKIGTSVEEKPLDFSTQESNVDCPKVDEKPPATPVSCNPLEMNVDGKEEENLSLDCKTNTSNLQQDAPCTPIDCSLEKSQENPVSDASQMGTPVTGDPENDSASPDRQVSLDNLGNSEDINPIVESDLVLTLHSPKRSSEPSSEDAILNTPSHINSKSEESLISVFQSSSKPEAVVSPVVPSFGLAKGILMRNPRGCRGICNCLNCASFRLNAEKSFEFSRNQLLDAEELAMDLMKEMSNLRCMLERCVNGADHNAILPADQVTNGLNW